MLLTVASPSGWLLAESGDAGDTRLVVAALAGITVLVLLVTVVKLHPLLSLTLGALVVGAVAGENLNDTGGELLHRCRRDRGRGRTPDRPRRDRRATPGGLGRRRPDR